MSDDSNDPVNEPAEDIPELTKRRQRKADSIDTSTHPSGHQPDKVIISEVERRLRKLKFFADESSEEVSSQSEGDDSKE